MSTVKKINLQPVILITWIVIILCLAAIAMMIKIYLIDNYWGHDWDFLVYSIPLLIPSLVFIMLLYNLKREYTQQQTELKEDNCLAHWKYNEDEWMRFNLAEWKKSRNKALGIPLGILMIFFLIGLIDAEFSTGELSVAAPYVIIFFVSLSLILLFYTYVLYKRTETCPREVLIGSNGFLYGGYYNSWSVIGTRLNGVKLLQCEFTSLQFDIEVWGKGGYNKRPLRVLIPKGHVEEAKRVIEELQEKKASFS